jgi:hypothetical protein
VTKLEILRRRRELVLLSAELQRATLARRISRVDANPARLALQFAAKAASVPLAWKLGSKVLRLAVRAYQRRSGKKRGRLFAT